MRVDGGFLHGILHCGIGDCREGISCSRSGCVGTGRRGVGAMVVVT